MPWRASVAWLVGCGAAALPPTQPIDDDEPPQIAVSLRLADAGETDAGAPVNDASLVLIHHDGTRELEPLGQVAGACHHRPPAANELLRVECWWAGETAALQVARRTNQLVVVHTAIAPDAEATTRAVVSVPADAELRAITPRAR